MSYTITGNYTNDVDSASGAEVKSDLEKGANAFNTHEASHAEHGATGEVVGTTNTQTMTNKTLTSPTVNTPTITSPTITGNIVQTSGTAIIPNLVVGQVVNLGVYKAAGVITIKGYDGSDLSATNPAWVCVPSALNAGQSIPLKLTANVTFNDDDHASSDWTNWTLGTTASVAWGNVMPLWILAINKDDTDAGLKLGISRVNKSTTPATAYLGDKDAKPATDDQSNVFIIGSVTEADYESKPSVLIGAITATKSAADDWTFTTPTAGVPIIGEPAIQYIDNYEFDMPTGQNGATSGKHLYDNGGTAPTFTTEIMKYYVKRNGDVDVHLSFTGNTAIDGVGGDVAGIALPHEPEANMTWETFGYGKISYGAGPTYVGVRIGWYSGALVNMDPLESTGTVRNSAFDDNGRTIQAALRYKAW